MDPLPEGPLRRAVALAYEPGERAPRVVAKGSRELAEEIIARARAAGVFVHESPELVAMLMQVDLDEHIPEALYLVVAELLAWVWRVESGILPGAGAGTAAVDARRARGHPARASEPPAARAAHAAPSGGG